MYRSMKLSGAVFASHWYKGDFQYCYQMKDKERILKCCLMVYIFLKVHRFSGHGERKMCQLAVGFHKNESLYNYRSD